MCAAIQQKYSITKETYSSEMNATLGDVLSCLRDASPLWVVDDSVFLVSHRIDHLGYYPVLVLGFENIYLHRQTIIIYGKDIESAAEAATCILCRQDDIFDAVALSFEGANESSRATVPFSCSQIMSILQSNPHREYKFENYEFTEQQAWTLATTDLPTRFSFVRCNFVDGGVSFCRGSSSRSTPYGILAFEQDIPFHEASWCALCRLLGETFANRVPKSSVH